MIVHSNWDIGSFGYGTLNYVYITDKSQAIYVYWQDYKHVQEYTWTTLFPSGRTFPSVLPLGKDICKEREEGKLPDFQYLGTN
jgi:hypothetical protein